MATRLITLLSLALLAWPWTSAEAQSVGQGIPLSAGNSYERIQERLSQLHAGAEVMITVLREGRLLELKAKLP